MAKLGDRSAADRSAMKLHNGQMLIFNRDGIYQARIHVGKNYYICRSLKTFNRAMAIEAGHRLFHELKFKRDEGIPLTTRTFGIVIKEYVRFRAKQHDQGHTSWHMLRQIDRVARFWYEYAGHLSIERIGDPELAEYILWRKDYYTVRGKRHPNVRINPTDKTLQWEMSLGKAIVRFAHSRGYRGIRPLPTYSFTPKRKRVRPAFEIAEYRKLLRAIVKLCRQQTNDRYRHTRLLLRDYVLILANSGMRVGEANSLKLRDVERFEDGKQRRNYRFKVKGKTGERDVILRASAVKSVDRLLSRLDVSNPDQWLFAMPVGSKVITLADQFDKALSLAQITTNSYGEKFTLYSLRHFYAVQALRRGIGVFDIARNMGTSVQVIQNYYGKHATPMVLATQLGE